MCDILRDMCDILHDKMCDILRDDIKMCDIVL